MKLALIFSAILALGEASALAGAPQRPMDVLTEEWGPITYEENGHPRGFAVEVVAEIQKRIKTKNIIQIVPWARGYREVQSQPNVVLFTVYRSKEREKLFTLLGPLVTSEVALYGLADANLQIKSLADAKQVYSIAANQDTWFATTLERSNFKNLLLTKNPQQEASLLAAGRVDLISNDPVVIKKAFAAIGKKHIKIKRYLTVEKGDLYIAFSKGTPPATIQKWKEALVGLKKDGTFEQLQKKWLPDSHFQPIVHLVGYGVSDFGP